MLITTKTVAIHWCYFSTVVYVQQRDVPRKILCYSLHFPSDLANKNSVGNSNAPQNNLFSLISLPLHLAKNRTVLRKQLPASSCCFLSNRFKYPLYLSPATVAMIIVLPPRALLNVKTLSRGHKHINLALECRASFGRTCVSQTTGISRRSKTEVDESISRHWDRTWQYSTFDTLVSRSRNRRIRDAVYSPLTSQDSLLKLDVSSVFVYKTHTVLFAITGNPNSRFPNKTLNTTFCLPSL
jgi:hypothetical protein